MYNYIDLREDPSLIEYASEWFLSSITKKIRTSAGYIISTWKGVLL